jgi:hypothetical protein
MLNLKKSHSLQRWASLLPIFIQYIICYIIQNWRSFYLHLLTRRLSPLTLIGSIHYSFDVDCPNNTSSMSREISFHGEEASQALLLHQCKYELRGDKIWKQTLQSIGIFESSYIDCAPRPHNQGTPTWLLRGLEISNWISRFLGYLRLF